MFSRGSILAGILVLACWFGVHDALAQGVFTLSSPGFKDGERLATKNAGNNKANPNCVGDNVSPALSWANPPEGTKSYALLMFDPEGRPPGGVSHWVSYGIPASWVTLADKTEDRTWPGKPLASGMAVDPANPPLFESQATFLDRHDMLVKGERARLKPEDFAPEAVAVDDDDE